MLEPNGFWSYAASDDAHSGGRVSLFRKQLTSELQLNVGKNQRVDIFLDSESIPTGAEWETAIRGRLATTSFLVSIVTPASLQSEWCCREVMLFREREKQLGRADLIFPILFIDTAHVDSSLKHDCFDAGVFALLKQRQHADYTKLRLKNPNSQASLLKIESLARAIRDALRKGDVGSGGATLKPSPPDPDSDSKIEALLDVAEQSGAFERAGEQGISERAVRQIVERVGGQGVERDDLVKWLDEWITAASRELARHTNEDEAFEKARQEAERRLKQGLGGASAALMDEFAREERQEQERQEERRRRQLRILEEAARFDELSLDIDGAVGKLRRMAEVEGLKTPDEIGAFLFGKAKDSYERGDRKGENAALSIAIGAYRAALEERTRDRVPLNWAVTQNNLGNALATLGARESGTARLEEAVTAFRAALEEWTRDRVPLGWAKTQNNLGNALYMLGNRESGTARLEQAVAAYRAALEERARDRVPLDWATTQNNLGNALATLGERERGTARLEEAVAAYRAALEERARDRVPLDWATTQNNLGAALMALGARESGTARLEEAVTAYRAALEESTRDRVPLDWATTQNNLGNALATLGERESGTARLEEAVTAYRTALEERTRDRVPLAWAMTQNNLGAALSTLGARESGTARLEEAVTAYRAALEELTRDRVPLAWATSLGNQGVALMRLAERTRDPEMARRALDQIETAFETMRDGGHAPFAKYYENQLPEARALCERLAES